MFGHIYHTTLKPTMLLFHKDKTHQDKVKIEVLWALTKRKKILKCTGARC